MLLSDRRHDVPPKQRTLIARLAQGAAGRALGFDLAAYTSARADAMLLLHQATQEPDHTALFKMTETYRAGAEGQQKTTALLRTFTLLLEDSYSSSPEPPSSSATPTSAPNSSASPKPSPSTGSNRPPAPSIRSGAECAATSSATLSLDAFAGTLATTAR